MKKLLVVLILTIGTSVTTTCNAQFTKLHDFNGTNGTNPEGKLLLAGRTLYGMTYSGGAHDSGLIYSIDTNGNNYRVLHNFSGYPTDGAHTYGSLTLIGTTLFGMTGGGGTNTYGTIFSLDTNGNNYRTLYSFDNVNASYPWAGFTVIGNKLYGTTSGDEVSNNGNIFSIDTDGSNYRNIYSFTGGANGAAPVSNLTLSGHKFYGATNAGGYDNYGTEFSIDTNGTNFKVLFDLGRSNTGVNTYNSVVIAGNKVYGTENDFGCDTLNSGANHTGAYGTISSVDTDGSYAASVFCYDGVSGEYPDFTPVIVGSTMYCMAGSGTNADSAGFIFSIDTSGINQTLPHVLFTFNGLNGSYPIGEFTVAGTTLYGITSNGGTSNKGVIYKYADITAGVNNLQQPGGGVTVYPNPSNGVFEVKSEEIRDNSTMEVYNMLGERIYSATLSIQNSTFNIDLSGQTAGIYLYRVMSESGNLLGQGKLVIEK